MFHMKLLYNVCVYAGRVRFFEVNTVTVIIFLLEVVRISFSDDMFAFRDLIATTNTHRASVDRVSMFLHISSNLSTP